MARNVTTNSLHYNNIKYVHVPGQYKGNYLQQ